MARQQTDEPLTPAGWPRPIIGGWPIPWVSPPNDLSQTDPDRIGAVITRRLCQVCGLSHASGSRTFFCVSGGNEGTSHEVDLSTVLALPMDNGIMHERCARLAIARCPKLRALKGEGVLFVMSAPVEAFVVRDFSGSDHLAVRGDEARHEDGF